MKLLNFILIAGCALVSVFSLRRESHKGAYSYPCMCSSKTGKREKENDEKKPAFCGKDLTCDCSAQMCYYEQGAACDNKKACANGLTCKMNDSLKYKACAQ
jgi:hypothetical protein